MKKKAILFATGLLLAGSGFWLYTRMTDSNLGWSGPPEATTEPEPLLGEGKLLYEDRRDNNEIELRVTAKEAHAVKGKSMEFDLVEPRARYRVNENQVVIVAAERGHVTLQPGVKRGSMPTPQVVTLSQAVTLTIGPKETFGEDDEPQAMVRGQLRGELKDTIGADGKVSGAAMKFEVADRMVSSPDRIEMHGAAEALGLGGGTGKMSQVSFAGRGLTLIVNKDQGRLECLRINEGEKCTFKPGDGGFEAITRAKPAATASGATTTRTEGVTRIATTASTPTAKKPKAAPAVYRLVLNSDVHVNGGATENTASKGGLGISGDTLAATFRTGGQDDAKSSTQRGDKGGTSDPLGDKLEELTITWKGPLEMRPLPAAEAALVKGRDAVLEVTGTAARPVEAMWEKAVVRAGRLRYHTESQVAEFEAGALKEVELAEPSLGLAKAPAGTADRRAKHATLTGPGRVEAMQASTGGKEPLTVTFQESVAVDWAGDMGAKGSEKKSFPIRHAVFAGAVEAHDPTFNVTSPKMEFTAPGSAEGAGADAHGALVFSGGVKARIARQGMGLTDADSPNVVTTKNLDIRLLESAKGKTPVADRIIAEGNVVAVMHETEKNSDAAEKTGKLTTQRIEAPKVEIVASVGEKKGSGTNAFGGFVAKEVHATGGVKVEVEGYGPQTIVATCQELLADPKAGTAELLGSKESAKLTQGDSGIQGGKILLSQKAQSIDIPGPGDFTFVQAGKKGEAAMPVKVAWLEKMRFDQKSKTGEFDGSVRATLLGKADQTSTLASDKLKVVLTSDADAGAGMNKSKLGEIIATGKVKAEGLTFDAAGKMQTRQTMQASTLTYTEANKTLTIPVAGDLVVEDYRPDPKGKAAESKSPMGGGNARGMTGFRWEKSLVYAGDTGLVKLEKNVRMVYLPTEPFKSVNPKKAASAGGKESRAELSCQSLVAKIIGKEEGVSASPVAFGTSGQVRVSMVKAEESAVLEVDDQQIAGDLLEFDLYTNTATASGKNGNLVTIVSNELGQGTARRAKWDLTKDANQFETWQFTIRGGG